MSEGAARDCKLSFVPLVQDIKLGLEFSSRVNEGHVWCKLAVCRPASGCFKPSTVIGNAAPHSPVRLSVCFFSRWLAGKKVYFMQPSPRDLA